MYQDSLATQATRRILDAAERHGANISPTIRTKLDKKLAHIDTAEAIQFPGATVPEAMYAAIEAGNDVATDSGVRDAYFRAEVQRVQINGQLTYLARVGLLDTISENFEAIVAAFKPAYDAAGEKFTKAHAVLTEVGITGLDDDQLKSAPLPFAKANLEARTAANYMHSILEAINFAAVTIGRNDTGTVGAEMQAYDTGEATVFEVRQQGKNVSPWKAADAGWTISLATPAEAKERLERAHNAGLSQQAALDAKSRDAFLRSATNYFGSPA